MNKQRKVSKLRSNFDRTITRYNPSDILSALCSDELVVRYLTINKLLMNEKMRSSFLQYRLLFILSRDPPTKLSFLNQLFLMTKSDESQDIRYRASLVLIYCLNSLSVQSAKFEKSICAVYIF